MTNFVLVHGAWCGSWAWRDVVPLLRSRGHSVLAPTLSGLAERSHCAGPIDLDTHVRDVVSLLEWEELDDVVLCGHSYGGMVITGVVEQIPARIRSVVYLDAFLPLDGKSLLDFWPPDRAALLVDAAEQHDGGASVPPIISAAAFGTAPERCEWVDKRFRPHPLQTLQQPIRVTGARDSLRSRTYVRALGFNGSFGQFQDRTDSDPAWESVTVPCGHMVATDMPERTAEILETAAASRA